MIAAFGWQKRAEQFVALGRLGTPDEAIADSIEVVDLWEGIGTEREERFKRFLARWRDDYGYTAPVTDIRRMFNLATARQP